LRRGTDRAAPRGSRAAPRAGGGAGGRSALTRGAGRGAQNTRETAAAVAGKDLTEAKKYLTAVLERTRCIPFRRFCGGVGRTAQAKNENSSTGQGRWPVKSVEFILGLLKNAESNAEVRACRSRPAPLPRRGSAAHARRAGRRARLRAGPPARAASHAANPKPRRGLAAPWLTRARAARS
jgi:ribosomal protein uL22